jgi:hypothetical protein
VSLNDKTGALRATEPAAGSVCAPGTVLAVGADPEPPQATKQNAKQSIAQDRIKNAWGESM